ncbi:uncharacterized protein LOC133877538 isoform X1 [Alnus glutinosa]|uniref:uncharacterized protein LOC133877538 isoform X1 n=1 Tax=Alnus glutinosa TaxID=3517 RepID=UPI002D77D994|nr:uncharacterized protein LOC133877538 isoform X1 [Alnus glutinosa]
MEDDDIEVEYYKQVEKQRAAKLAAKAEIYSRDLYFLVHLRTRLLSSAGPQQSHLCLILLMENARSLINAEEQGTEEETRNPPTVGLGKKNLAS